MTTSEVCFCPQCCSAAVDYSGLVGAQASCRGCGWYGEKIDLLSVPVQHTFLTDESMVLRAVEAATGKTAWTTDLPTIGIVNAAARDGELFVLTDRHGYTPAPYLWKLGAASGKVLWSFEVPIGPQWEGYASAVAVGHVNVFVASANGRILGMARSDGWLAWKRAFADVSEPPGWVIPLDPT